MKISRRWLQKYFERELPNVHDIAKELTFHAFEIESIGKPNNSETWDIFDVKVTANRGHDCLSHLGIAREISAILQLPLKSDPLSKPVELSQKTDALNVEIENPSLCPRYIAGIIRGVKVGPSPDWLRQALESVGQRSVNNIVDAANYVMLDIGQPLHAFDASKLASNREQKTVNREQFRIRIRKAKSGERITTLDERKFELNDSMLVIADGNSEEPIAIAGVKGGKSAEVTGATTDIILESANFNGVSVRKTAAALKLRTDASDRFQHVISAELAASGMRALADLIVEIAGGEIDGFVDAYPRAEELVRISFTASQMERILGLPLRGEDVAAALTRLKLPMSRTEDPFEVSVPFYRFDLRIPEDLAEEIVRIIGYENVKAAPLPPFPKKPEVNANFYAAEKAREELLEQGYSEIFTSVFADSGELEVANKVGGERPFLRNSLVLGLKDALERNMRVKDLFGLEAVNIFEIGTVWKNGEERTMVGTATEKEGASEYELVPDRGAERYERFPISGTKRYQPFPRYPYIVRDISLWVPDADSDAVERVIRDRAGEMLRRIEMFDTFKKGDKTSFAFRLIFQSFEKTLTDEEANAIMENIYAAAKRESWEVR